MKVSGARAFGSCLSGTEICQCGSKSVALPFCAARTPPGARGRPRGAGARGRVSGEAARGQGQLPLFMDPFAGPEPHFVTRDQEGALTRLEHPCAGGQVEQDQVLLKLARGDIFDARPPPANPPKEPKPRRERAQPNGMLAKLPIGRAKESVTMVRVAGMPTIVLRATIEMSAIRAISNPPPSAKPRTSATITFG